MPGEFATPKFSISLTRTEPKSFAFGIKKPKFTKFVDKSIVTNF